MNTIRPSASRPSHPSTTTSTKTMDLVAAAAAALEASSTSTSPQKRPINHASNYGSNYNHHQHSHNHNDRRKNVPMMGHLDSWRIDKGLETQSMSNADSAALRASLTQSRQTWTHSAFSRFKPQTVNNGGHKAQFTPVSEVSLAGVCTVSIGPHIFLDTKFFTVLNSDSESPAIKAESTRDRSRSPSRQRTTHYQVALEFKENSGAQWLFPEEASLEFFPANERDSAQVTASFNLPLRDNSRQGRPQSSRTGDQDIVVDMTISHATTALWEGLELAVKGPRTVHRSGAHRSHASGHRSRTSSTYDEDPSEILGSGKRASQSSESLPMKRKQDGVADHQRTKLKKPKHEQDEKPPVKKAGSSTSPRKNGTSTSSATASTQQKRCGYCNCSSTPMWRRGPKGPSTLCNACGVKWKHGKILQDQVDTQIESKTGGSSSTAPHAPPVSASRPLPSKTVKESSGNRGQPADDHSSHIRNNKKPSPGTAGHGGRRDSKISEPEKIIPVKKRHLAPTVSPVGPRMVPIHQLDNRDHTPTPKKNGLTHLLDVASEELKSTLFESAQNKAKASQAPPSVAPAPTPALLPVPTPAPALAPALAPPPARTQAPVSTPTPAAPRHEENSLALFPVRTTFTNNTATFPLHFPTISVGFGPNNASYNYPNCAVVLYENHFQIQLVQAGERTAIDVWKEGIEGTEFQVVDVGDGESMIVMKALSRQYLTRFDKELLNPDRNETLIVFRFRERLGGGGPPVKPLLEHWLATDIPVPPPPTAAMDGAGV